MLTTSRLCFSSDDVMLTDIPLHQIANVWMETPRAVGKALGCGLLAQTLNCNPLSLDPLHQVANVWMDTPPHER